MNLAEELKNTGINMAIDNALGISPKWQDQAIEHLRNFKAKEFMAEELRQHAYDNGLDPPPSERAWGAVINEARRKGLIQHIGYRAVSNPTAHQTPAGVWRKVA